MVVFPVRIGSLVLEVGDGTFRPMRAIVVGMTESLVGVFWETGHEQFIGKSIIERQIRNGLGEKSSIHDIKMIVEVY